MVYDENAIKSAVKFLICNDNKICRVCLAPGTEEISIYDFVTINTPYNNDRITYLSIFQELGVPIECSLSEVLCQNCSSLACSSFIFMKLCEYSQKQWETSIASLDRIISESNSKDLTPKITSMYMMVGEDKNTLLTSKTPVDKTNKVSALLTAKYNMGRRSKYIKVEQRKHKMVLNKKEEKKQEIQNNNLTCTFCDKTFVTKQNLEGHKERIHYPKTVKCDICSQMLSTEKQLQSHKDMYHVPVVCKQCGLEVPSRHKLQRHKDMKHYANSCSRCEKQFKTATTYHHHIRLCGRIISQTKYICDICAKEYVNKTSLKGHMISEHGFGSAICCRWCNKKFHCLSALTGHEVKHTRERNFTCEICGGKFVTNRALIYHRRLHTGEKPYPCDMCDMSFLNASRRIAHKSRAHLGPNKQCDICPAKFHTKYELKEHRQRHDNPHSRHYVGKINAFSLKTGKGKMENYL